MSVLRGRGLREAVVVMRESQGGRRTRMGDSAAGLQGANTELSVEGAAWRGLPGAPRT